MKTVFTAIFSAYEELKEPAIITKGWQYKCFTDQPFKSNTWQVIKIKPELSARMQARRIKILWYEYIEDEFSLWLDGSFKINIDLNKWWQRFKTPITCIKHPYRNCVYDEAKGCMVTKRGERDAILKQIKSYEGIVPKNNGVIQSGILMRQKTGETIELCKKWWHEIETQSNRDQIGFAKASLGHRINYIDYDYRTGKEFEFIRHFHKRKT